MAVVLVVPIGLITLGRGKFFVRYSINSKTAPRSSSVRGVSKDSSDKIRSDARMNSRISCRNGLMAKGSPSYQCGLSRDWFARPLYVSEGKCLTRVGQESQQAESLPCRWAKTSTCPHGSGSSFSRLIIFQVVALLSQTPCVELNDLTLVSC